MDFDDDDGGDEVVDLTEDTAPQGEGEGEEEELGGEEGEEGEPDIPLQPPGRGKAQRPPRVPKPCVGTQAKKLAESFFKAFVVSTTAGKIEGQPGRFMNHMNHMNQHESTLAD